ncbi:MAG: DUF1080 domain-containing protein [Zavarzinella sp.]
MKFSWIAVALFAIVGTTQADEWKSLFNGKDLTGWSGVKEYWTVEDGAITGKTDGNIPNNSFIVWDGKLKDFELKLQFKIVGGNSGVQYRAKLVDKEKFIISGYQADIDSAARKQQYNGILYEERGRGFLCNRGTKTWIDEKGARHELRVTPDADVLAKLKGDAWNEYEIIAKANHLVQKINGQVTAEVIDFQKDKRAMEGLLAFQIHRGMGNMVVQFKDIKLKELTDCTELTPADMPIPAEAKNLNPPKKVAPKKK